MSERANISAMDEIRGAVEELLQSSGAGLRSDRDRLSRFLEEIRPDVEAALLAGDTMSLGYLRDRAVIQLGRVSLGALHKQRMLVAQTVVTVLRTLIRVGITAL